MADALLIPALAQDPRSQAIAALAQRLTAIDLAPLRVMDIDHVAASALPYLAEQFNVVGPLWAYLPDEAAQRRAIKESIAWHRIKGTPQAVRQALSWIGLDATVDDLTSTASRWAEYQLDFKTPLPPAKLKQVVEIAAFAAPARAHLVRAYSNYDIRPLTWDVSRWDEAIWDDDSGEWVDGIKLSNSTRVAHRSSPIERSVTPNLVCRYTRVVRRDASAWDQFSWDQPMRLMDAGSTLIKRISSAVAAPPRRVTGYVCITSGSAVAQNKGATKQYVNQITTTAPSANPRRRWVGAWSGPWRPAVFGKYISNGG